MEKKIWIDEEEEETEEESGLVDLVDDEGSDLLVLLEGIGSEELDASQAEHGDNLAEYMSDSDLNLLSHDLIQKYDEDLSSRSEWEERYQDGIKLLGIKPEEKNEPWPNACGVFHPVLMETIIGFQSNAMIELVPASGPAKFKCIGQETSEKLKLGVRVSNELNYQLMERMKEWRQETEQLLFRLPTAGTCLKKVYFDPLKKRPTSKMVPADDFVVQFGVSDLETAPRFCHRERMFVSDVKKLQMDGFYRDCDLETSPLSDEQSIADEAEGELIGLSPSGVENDAMEILEFHCDHVFDELEDSDGRPVPYIITIEKSSMKVLAIRRNWEEGDPEYTKKEYFVPYHYMPGFGFYSFGVLHVVGGAADACTSLLRQLTDAGTLSNVPSGFKTNSFRVLGNDTPIKPGEFRDVDLGGAKITDGLLPLPYKEPSAVGFQLLQHMVDETRRVASVAEMKLGDAGAQAPVGTTLALLERSMRVMSAVHARLHASLKRELKLIAKLIKDNMGPEYDYDKELGFNRSIDFGGPVDIIPVSDPNSSTQAQRVIVYQAAIQIAAQAPQVYDQPRLHRGMLHVLGIPDAEKIVPLPEDMTPVDPVSENMQIIMMKPVKAFIQQDHEAHLRVHMAAMQDPKMQASIGQSPQAAAIQAAAYAHIQEHLAYAYRRDIERKMGMMLPPPMESIPDDTEALIANLAAEAAEMLIRDHAAEAQAAMMAQQAQDPETALKIEELKIKAGQVQLQGEKLKQTERIQDKTLKFKEKELAVKTKIKDEELKHDLDKTMAVEAIRGGIQREANQNRLANSQTTKRKKSSS